MALSPDHPQPPKTRRSARDRVRKGFRSLLLGCEVLEDRLLLTQTSPIQPPFYADRSHIPAPIRAEFVQDVASYLANKPPAQAVEANLSQPLVAPAFRVTQANNPPDPDMTAGTPNPAIPPGFHFAALSAAAAKLDDDGEPIEIDGTLNPPGGMRFFGIPIHPETGSIHLDADAFGPDFRGDDHLYLFDGMQHLFASYGLPENGDRFSLTAAAEMPGTIAGSELIVGISSDTAGLSSVSAPVFASASTSTFSLWISQTSDVAATTTTIVSSGSQSTGLTSSAQTTDSTSLEADAGSLGDDSTGPMPTRAAGPSGGILTESLPIPPMDRTQAAVVDMSLIDLVAEDAVEFAASRKKDRRESDGLVEIRSSSGFPLLGTSLAPNSPSWDGFEAPSPKVAEIATTSPAMPVPTEPPKLVDPHGISIQPGAVLLGLGIAGSLAFTLMLPDLEKHLQPEQPKRPRLKIKP